MADTADRINVVPPPALQLQQTAMLAANDSWTFCVGRMGDRWLGFAVGFLEDGAKFVNVFPEVSEGAQLGIRDYARAVKLTTAIAQDPEQGLGGVEHWFIPPGARGNPDDFRCANCDRVGCDGEECRDYDEVTP